ncbi:MAG: type III secretion system translocon subunit SctE [Kiritimatiellae bacterium]|nr:type III secretion system translocon subunit SctE [Kiritimatiellia bacterium]
MSGEMTINSALMGRQGQIDQVETMSKGLGISAKTAEAVKEIAGILAGRNVTVNTNTIPARLETGTPTGATGVPSLDNPADLKSLEENLEKLLAYLQLDNEERQAEMAKERIEVNKESLQTEHEERSDKIKESLDKMEEAAKSRLVNRIFGWLGAIIAVAAAIVTTVVTGGAAAAFAIAGAAVAVTSLILSETGAMDKITNALAEHLQDKYGMSKSTAQIVAALTINLSIMAISLGCSVGGMIAGAASAGKAVADSIRTVAKVVQSCTQIGSTAVGLGSMAAGAASTAANYKSQMAQADVTELEKIMLMLQQRLDESEEELNAILEAIQNSIGQIAELLASETDTQSEIATQIGQMA